MVMRIFSRKTLVGAALVMAFGLAASAPIAPASAGIRNSGGGGGHMGGGAFHGGGMFRGGGAFHGNSAFHIGPNAPAGNFFAGRHDGRRFFARRGFFAGGPFFGYGDGYGYGYDC